MELVWLDVVSRWIHISTAIALLGGAIFSRFVLMPAAAELPDTEHDKLRAGVLARWKRFVHLGIALLLLSGFYNFFPTLEPHHHIKKMYHPLMGVKILLAFAVFFLASAMVGRSSLAITLRKNALRWAGVIVLLGLIIVAISSYAKVALPGKSAAVVSENP